MKTLAFLIRRSFSVGGLFVIAVTMSLNIINAQDTWIQKADFAGSSRSSAVGFSIGDKGYLGTGNDGDGLNDFWEYDTVTNAWTQKADFPGTPRWAAVGFSIGDKGYLGTGFGHIYPYRRADFWEYDPSANTWTQKADFGGGPRHAAFGFSMGNKGYVGTGVDFSGDRTNDFWEYDPSTNAWTEKAAFAGGQREAAVGFSIDNMGYAGTGDGHSMPFTKSDLWQYDPSANTWTQKSAFPGGPRVGAVGFSIESKGYVGTGAYLDIFTYNYYNDFWEYDPSSDTWIMKAAFEGTERAYATEFFIGNRGYITGGAVTNDFWQYTPGCVGLTIYPDLDGDTYGDANSPYFAADCVVPSGYIYDHQDCNDADSSIKPAAQEVCANSIDDNCNGVIDENCTSNTTPNSWIKKADFPGAGTERIVAVGFSIGSKGYIGTGSSHSVYKNDFWEYDTLTNVWTQKAHFIGTPRQQATGFSIGSKGYIGTGYAGSNQLSDFYEYDPATNTWTSKANVGGMGREGAVGFSIGNKGYVGTGLGNNFQTRFKDFWEYDPVTNAWTQKADVGGSVRTGAVGFSIGSKGYIGTGSIGSGYLRDFWEYDPVTNSWTQRADFGGPPIGNAAAFSIGNKGYIGTGSISGGGSTSEFWEYDPDLDGWIKKADYGAGIKWGAVGFSIGSRGYIGTGCCNDVKEFWEYTPGCSDFTIYADMDEDGYGDATINLLITNCIVPSGYVYDSTDCNDADATIHKGTPEICLNNIDDNCNGLVDENCVICAVPSNLKVVNITATSAKLKWDAVAGAEAYTVRYKVANTSGWKYGTTYNSSKPISGLLPNTIYKWEVQTFCHVDPPYVMSDWSSKREFTTGSLRIGDESLQQVSFQLYPNPAEDHTTIQFTLPQSSRICIKVYDVSGKEIETLLDDDLEQGEHSLLLNTNQFPKGVYFVKMISPAVLRDGIENQKLIVQ